jgi:hypothetical protein
MLPSSAPATDAELLAGLSLFLRAPSRDAAALLLHASFRLRHDTAALLASPALSAFALPPTDGAKLALSALTVVRRALYESSELSSEMVASKLPAGLDARLATLVTQVRLLALHLTFVRAAAHDAHAYAPPPRLPQILTAALPAWREAAIESRVSLPRLEGISWSVDTAAGSGELAAAAEPLLRLSLDVRGAPARADTVPATETLAVTIPPAALGALVEGMRRVRDQLGALHAQ